VDGDGVLGECAGIGNGSSEKDLSTGESETARLRVS
jgi:hypothetical protein